MVKRAKATSTEIYEWRCALDWNSSELRRVPIKSYNFAWLEAS